MAKQPYRYTFNDGQDWVEFKAKLPMAKLEEMLNLSKEMGGEDNLAVAKKMAVYIPTTVETWSLESDPHTTADVVLWDVEDGGDLIAIIEGMGEYIQHKLNRGK